MICRLKGKIVKKDDLSVILDVNGICYEIFVPRIIMKVINDNFQEDSQIELVTYHYSQVELSKSIPVLIGFLNEVEREFFESFITVSGIGPKAAVKALNMPISQIAQAIDEGSVPVLKSLPGIGERRAREIIAKLQGKVGKFGLVRDRDKAVISEGEPDFQKEALEVLKQLQYKANEAKEMVAKALERSPGIHNAEELINEVYRQTVKK